MVGLMENTAIHCLEGMLEPDTDTVGIEIHVQHTKATAVGKKVMCKATIVEIDGRRIRIAVSYTHLSAKNYRVQKSFLPRNFPYSMQKNGHWPMERK